MAAVVMPQQHWDPNDNKYKCCCNSCHVKTGTMVIGVLEAIGVALQFLGAIVNFARIGSGYGGSFSGSLIGLGITIVILVFLFLGLKKEKAGYLLPHLVFQVIGMVVLLILGIALIIMATVSSTVLRNIIIQSGDASGISSDKVSGSIIAVAIAFGVTLIICFLLQIWWFLVVLHCYRFFKEQDLHGKTMPMAIQGQAVAYPVSGYGQQPVVTAGYGQQQGYQPGYPVPQPQPPPYTDVKQ